MYTIMYYIKQALNFSKIPLSFMFVSLHGYIKYFDSLIMTTALYKIAISYLSRIFCLFIEYIINSLKKTRQFTA